MKTPLERLRPFIMAPGARVPFSVLLLACGGTLAGTEDAGDAQRDGPSAGDGTTIDDAMMDSPSYLVCMDQQGRLNAALKACREDSDCIMKEHLLGCCGALLYVGVNKAAAAEFDACEAAWDAQIAKEICGCPPPPPGVAGTEDGKGTLPDSGLPRVHCSYVTPSGAVCLTYMP